MTDPTVPSASGITPAASEAREPVLVQIGDVGISQNWIVTPVGTVPTRGAQIFVTDATRTERYTPTWAIVLAILGALFFLLGLLFLLVRETRISGAFQFTIVNGTFTYQCFEAAQDNVGAQNFDVQNRVNYARGLIHTASSL